MGSLPYLLTLLYQPTIFHLSIAVSLRRAQDLTFAYKTLAHSRLTFTAKSFDIHQNMYITSFKPLKVVIRQNTCIDWQSLLH